MEFKQKKDVYLILITVYPIMLYGYLYIIENIKKLNITFCLYNSIIVLLDSILITYSVITLIYGVIIRKKFIDGIYGGWVFFLLGFIVFIINLYFDLLNLC
ncbi:MAG: hypothetical protein OHK0036_20120 [Bacteroidia bacterium]